MKKLLSILVLFPFAGIAQKAFSVDGSIKRLKNGDKIYLAYVVGSKQVFDSTFVSNSSFKFNGTISDVKNAYLFLNTNPYVKRPEKGEALDMLSFYLEPGQIKLSAVDSLSKAVVLGTPVNVENEELKKIMDPINDRQKSVNARYYRLTEEEKKNEKLMAGLSKESLGIWTELLAAKYSFVKTNPTSYLSLILLKELIEVPEYKPEARKSFDALSAVLKNTTVGKSIASSIAALEKTAIGAMAMDFEQNDINGKPVKLSDFKGKYLLLDFWASWCRPCRKENPHIVAAYQKYKDRGFTVLGVSSDHDKTAWLKAIAEDKLDWTQVCDLTGRNSVTEKYGIKGIPSNFLIDPAGKIVASQLRGDALERKLEEIFK